MAIIYDLMVANGSYQKEGQEKTSWLKIGRVMEKQKGGVVGKLDCIPTSVIDREGNSVAWDGWVQMFEPRAKEGQKSAPKPAPQPTDDGFDDIPF